MAQGTQEISLRRPDGTWAGMTDRSGLVTEGRGASFEIMDGMYHSRDGTELRRMLGSQIVGKPFLGEPYQIALVSAGGLITLNDTDPGAPAAGKHFLPAGDSFIYIESNIGGYADGIYLAARAGENTLQVDTELPAGATGAVGKAYLQRGRKVHALAEVDGRPVVVADTLIGNVVDGLETFKSLASWVGSAPLNLDAVQMPGNAYKASPSIEATDTGFIIWPAPTMRIWQFDQGALTNSFANSSSAIDDKLFTQLQLGRFVVDSINRRLLIAVPGHGCCFFVDLERDRLPIRISGGAVGSNKAPADHRWTKALGIPRALPYVTSSFSGGEYRISGGGLFTPGATERFWYAFAYYDPLTGDMGLMSEPLLSPASVPAAPGGYSFYGTVLTPRACLAETAGLAILMFVSTNQATLSGSVLPLSPWRVMALDAEEDTRVWRGTTEYYRTEIETTFVGSETVNEIIDPRRIPVIEQMPPGASWIKVCRGRSFFGGDRPTTSKISLLKIRRVPGPALLLLPAPWTVLTGHDDICYGQNLPSSYEGSRVTIPYIDPLFSRYAVETGLILRKDTMHAAGLEIGTFEFSGFVLTEETTYQTGYLHRDEGLVGFSEEGRPGISPGLTNRLPVDTLIGRRTTGLARIGDEALIFTEQEAHLFAWSLLPRQASSRVISNTYGCISPGSIIEGEGFAAWMSRDGPVLYSGGALQWIGEPLIDTWRTILRRSDGLADYIQGVHDRARGLLIWGVDTDFTVVAATDAERSLEAAGLLWIFNYRAASWTIHTRSPASRVQAMAVMSVQGAAQEANENLLYTPCWVADRTVEFSEQYSSIHMLDERFLDRTHEPVIYTATAARDLGAGSAVFSTSGITYTYDDGLSLMEGDRAFIRRGRELIWFGAVGTVTAPGTINIEDAEGAHWLAGDALEGKLLHMSMRTYFFRVGDMGLRMVVRGAVTRHYSFQDPATTHTPYTWIRIRAEDLDGTIVTLSQGQFGQYVEDGSNVYRSGSIQANNLRLHIDVISNVQVRIKDIAIEVENQR